MGGSAHPNTVLAGVIVQHNWPEEVEGVASTGVAINGSFLLAKKTATKMPVGYGVAIQPGLKASYVQQNSDYQGDFPFSEFTKVGPTIGAQLTWTNYIKGDLWHTLSVGAPRAGIGYNFSIGQQEFWLGDGTPQGRDFYDTTFEAYAGLEWFKLHADLGPVGLGAATSSDVVFEESYPVQLRHYLMLSVGF